MEYKNIQKNKKGYQTVFQCSKCGKYFDLEDLRYFGLPETPDENYHICIHCLADHQNQLKEEAREIPVHLAGELDLDEEDTEED